MSLPLKAIERLFDRLQTTYGRQFTALYEGLEPAAVKASWAHELSSYEDRLEAIAFALENLPERVPNAIEFRNIARRAPSPEAPRLPEPAADPARVAAELAKLADVRKAAPVSGYDHKAWARRLIAGDKAGERITPICLRMAKDALRTPGERAAA